MITNTQAPDHESASSTGSSKSKDIWDKMSAAGAILLPIVVAIVGAMLADITKQRELRAEYVKVAADILQKGDSEVPKPMRLWALQVLRGSSPAPMPPELEAAVMSQKLERPQYTTGEDSDWGFLEFRAAPEDQLYVRMNDLPIAITPITVNRRPGSKRIAFTTETGDVVCSGTITQVPNTYTIITCNSETKQMSSQRKW